MKYFRKLFFIVLILSASISFAKGKKRAQDTVLNFEDELIEGAAKKPELFYLLERKQVNFKKLIQLRDDFLPEMRRTSEQINRIGGDN